jgi:hypothetical protein
MYSFLIDTDSNPGILLINNLSSRSENPAGGKALVNTDRCNRSDKMSETVGRSLNPVAATEDDVHVSKDFREKEDPTPNVPKLNELSAAVDCVSGWADEPKLNELAAAAVDCVAGWADEPKLNELAAAAVDCVAGWADETKLNELAAAAVDCVAGWADETKLNELAAAAADGREG